MDEVFDINAEYEKLHGPVFRKMLFDEEEYKLLRKEITDSPKNSFNSLYGSSESLNRGQLLRKKYGLAPLPFDNIALVPNRVLVLEKTISSEKNFSHHLYYIKKEENGQLISYAAGYLSLWGNGEFIVLGNSFFSEDVNKTRATELAFWKYLKYERKYGFCYEKANRKYESASDAARWYLGEQASDNMWIDDHGRSLVDDPAYKKLMDHTTETKSNEQLTFDFGLPIVGTPNAGVGKLSHSGNGNGDDTSVKPKIKWGAHAFYLRTSIGESDVYDAKGYYDPTSGQFTIKEGSLLSLTTKAAKFDQSAAGHLRVNVLKENCIRERMGYRLRTDETFKDPIYAASIVVGKTVDGWNMWKDSKGLFLSAYTL